ncbi:conserved hypothetical protein [Desulfonatronospira thiodismutans ASO3-1]|uniref:Uncharacterized protein n=1 Tax=Desulfonatronospira thiodismutans ASO3-1 TaxID=555779 RepID=D6SR38_9BACT|nr:MULTISPECIES: hypothetical protein [Desulfonatronospira]EFI33154.1 conserved hypothetical protein [Desulfonatronospira thiodismutans ASO3-1]RQD76364.1 MAG: hypothetical protein D5S03_06445 [Desulfonatronospira sp. MSAO_Bac3]
MIKKFLLSIALVLLLLQPANAFELTDDRVERFVDSWSDVQSLEHEFEDIEQPDGEFVPESPFSASLEEVRGHEAYDRLQQIAVDHGFSDAQEWALTGDHIFRAFLGMEMQDEDPTAEMKQALEEIRQSPLPEEQKEQITRHIQEQLDLFERIQDVPAEDIETVRRHEGEINRIFEPVN